MLQQTVQVLKQDATQALVQAQYKPCRGCQSICAFNLWGIVSPKVYSVAKQSLYQDGDTSYVQVKRDELIKVACLYYAIPLAALFVVSGGMQWLGVSDIACAATGLSALFLIQYGMARYLRRIC
ncbi:MAG: SoxR reducing system RseC family protein [Candidatus Oxydemutatoraceae bacterium WSBS_2016_MAG_OTU14]